MTPDKIKQLLESYYSGDISPDDYEALLSTMKKVKNLPPELEKERCILQAIDSYEPIMPGSLEKMLSDAIDKQYRKSHYKLKMFHSVAAAAVLLISMATAIVALVNKDMSDPGYIVESDGHSAALSEIEEYGVISVINDEELDKAVQIVDESLLNLLSAIRVAQNEVTESLDNIRIKS